MRIDIPRRSYETFDPTKLDVVGESPAGTFLPIKLNGATIKRLRTVVATDGGAGTETATDARPAGLILGVTARVTAVISGAGAASFSLGDGSDADRYGTALAFALDTVIGTADATAEVLETLAAAGDIVLTANAGQFDAGELTIDVYYIEFDPPAAA